MTCFFIFAVWFALNVAYIAARLLVPFIVTLIDDRHFQQMPSYRRAS